MVRYNETGHKSGLAPGSLIHVGEQKVDSAMITVTSFDRTSLSSRKLDRPADLKDFKDASGVVWINIDGLHQVEVIAEVGELYGIHPLLQEDILNTRQRPKGEDFGDHYYLALKSIGFDRQTYRLEVEQVSILLFGNKVLTFQEKIGDVFKPLAERLKNEQSRLRKMGPDYLAYELLDLLVDNYFVVLEVLGEEVELLENSLVINPTKETLQKIHVLKRQILFIRRSVWPLREVIGGLERDDANLISESSKPFLRDLYDHIIQVIETIEIYRDALSGILDIYLSSISNRTNEVMKVLTIIATIFIPLTFIVGVYGMNFKYMPELNHPWAYPAVWVIMVGIAGLMLLYFRKRKWF